MQCARCLEGLQYFFDDAAKTMTEALERQDSAVLLMLLGNRNEGLAIMKAAVSDLMNLNKQPIYNTASHLESRAYRATMPGIVAIVAAFIFTIIFSFLVNLFIVNPIIKLTSNIEAHLDRRKSLDVRVEADDEISRLISSVEQLIRKSEK